MSDNIGGKPIQLKIQGQKERKKLRTDIKRLTFV